MALLSQHRVDYVALARGVAARRQVENEPAERGAPSATKATYATKGRSAAPAGSLRVEVDALEPRPGPVRLNGWTVVLHPERCIRADLASLERVVGALDEARRAGDRRAADYEGDAEELLARLEACGAKARIVEDQ
ncbi:MAG: hypothetical protein AB1689_12435 [Thermodesulfobacteriota bacterium]